MRKLLLFIVMLAIAATSMGQLSKLAGKYEKRIPKHSVDNGMMNPTQPANTTVVSKSALEDVLGTTRYDLQTNASCQNRFYTYPDGTMVGTWSMGQSDPSYADRGTGYSYFDGASWSAAPSARIETVRTGWPSYAPWNGNGELVIAHNSTSTLIMNTRPVKGTGTWTQKLAPAVPVGAPDVCWPRAITSGTNHQNIHVLALGLTSDNGGAVYNGLDGVLFYWRSTDGGVTWDKNGIQLPGLTSANYDGFSGEEYAWGAPHGDTIYFCVGGAYTDTFIMTSPDNGNTWSKIPILSNANKKIPASVTDISPWYTGDGAMACELGPGGIYHFVSGMGGGILQAGTKYILINRNGLIYWNSGMPMLKDSLNLDTLDSHGQLLGYYSDGPGAADTLNTIQDYGGGLTSHPQISIAANGNMTVIWDGITSQNPEPATGNNFRHIWKREYNYSAHQWYSDQIDLNSDISYIFMEFVYSSMAKSSSPGNVDFIYQTANTPGSAVYTTGLAVKTCNIEYRREVYTGVPSHETSKPFVGQNFPNPVSGITHFNAFLDKGSDVMIEITNIAGQKVSSLDKGYQAAGAHQFTIDAGSLQAGIYFYTVKVSGQTFTKKMIVE